MKASIIVPNLEPQGVLLPSIQALCTQTVDDYEVILPLFGKVSKEEHVILKHFEEQYPHFRTVKVSGDRSASLNQAVDKSDGKLLFFAESHCIADRNWLKRYLDRHQRKMFKAAFIEIKEVPSNIMVSKLVWRQRYRIIQKLAVDKIYDSFFDLHASCITRDCFFDMNGFSEEMPAMAEFELGARLHQKGIPIYRVPDEQVWHFNNRNLSSYEMIVRRQGVDRTRILLKHGREFMERYFPNPRFVQLLPLLRALRVPCMCAAQVFKLAQNVGFRTFEKSAPALSEKCFRGYAANCLRQGMLKGLK